MECREWGGKTHNQSWAKFLGRQPGTIESDVRKPEKYKQRRTFAVRVIQSNFNVV